MLRTARQDRAGRRGPAPHPAGIAAERSIKTGVRPELLPIWLGERLVTRCLQIEDGHPSMAQVQQIVDSLLPDVPIERWSTEAAPATVERQRRVVVNVVDRDAFALGIAREWVQSGLPRTRIR